METESLILFQNILCKLYTDGKYRDLFLSDKTNLINQLNLKPTEKDLLNNINKNELIRYSNSLINKRLSISKKLIPELFYHSSMDKVFIDFSRNNVLQENNKYTNDSLAFLNHITPSCVLEKELIRILKHRLQKSLKNNYFYFNLYNLDIENLHDYVNNDFIKTRFLNIDIKLFSYHFTFQKNL